MAEGGRRARADYLRNDGLLATVGGETRFLPLSIPRTDPSPLAVDLNKAIMKTELKNKFLPDAASLRLQLVGLDDKAFPKYEFKMGDSSGTRKAGEYGQERAPRWKRGPARRSPSRGPARSISPIRN